MDRSYRATPGSGPEAPGADPVVPAPVPDGQDAGPLPEAGPDAAGVRRRLMSDGVGISVSVIAFALIYGLAARQAGLSLVEGLAMSAIAFAGAAQFSALGLLAQGVPWLGIIVLTGILNARHLLYSASLAPWFAGTSRRERAVSAYILTDEAYALAMPAFRALGRHDSRTYLIAAGFTFVPWVSATMLGMLFGELMPDPTTLGLDVIFPAAMAGLAVVLVVDRRAAVAAVLGVVIGVGVALAVGPSVGIVAGGLAGPALALRVPRSAADAVAEESASDHAVGLP